ncbi:MAG: hypothetical protein KF832_22505 [Caldilineaceae bacterium]|nr:hypothetical protein [Caldilineaceae bacterium]
MPPTQQENFWQRAAFQPWQAFYQPAMPPAAQQAMGHFFNSQQQGEQLLQLVSEAWQAILTNATSPAEWQRALATFTDQWRAQLLTVMDSGKLLENQTELWRLYGERAQKLVQPWLTAWGQTMGMLDPLGGPGAASAAGEFFQSYQAAFDQTWGRAFTAPSLGFWRALQEKLHQGFTLWVANQQAMLTYHLLVGQTWIDAFQALMQKLMTMAQAGESFRDQRHLLRLWIEVADEIFLARFHSDDYAKVQSAYINSSMAWRRHQQTLMELWLRAQDLPTRGDLEEAHRQIYELRKEVKGLKKAMANSQTALVAPQATQRTPSKGRASAKPRAATKAAATVASAHTNPVAPTLGTQGAA